MTHTFLGLSQMPRSIADEQMCQLERFVILLYDRTSQCMQVNQARNTLFAKGRQIDHIPPTKGALVEHTKWAAYQAGYIWGQSLIPVQQVPDPCHWGWTKNTQDHWVPFWTALPEASKSCKELIKCGCKRTCRPPCKCCNASLPCTDLCNCAGTCHRTQ